MSLNIAFFFWDPRPEMFPWNLPLLGRPILWYGFLFAVGFLLGYWVLYYLLRHASDNAVKEKAKFLAEKLTFYIVVGTVIGARLVDVLFYQNWDQLVRDPFLAFKFWAGGLASHGGALGILVALWLFSAKYRKTFPTLSWQKILDLLVIPAGLAGCFIRLGNFVNQEVLGKTTTLPWAVVFGHPADGSYPAPRHPAQLYEAFFYLAIFFLFFCWLRKLKWAPGKLGGLFLVLVFSFRFCIEFLKEEPSWWMGARSIFDMGQLLSLPFIFLGLYLLLRKETVRM